MRMLKPNIIYNRVRNDAIRKSVESATYLAVPILVPAQGRVDVNGAGEDAYKKT